MNPKNVSFKTTFWLKNAHIHTLCAYYLRPRPTLTLTRERIMLPDGDFVDIDHINQNNNTPTVILLHGLEGSTQSGYILTLLKAIQELGWHGVSVNLRGCSGTLNQRPATYHSGEVMTTQTIIQHIKNLKPKSDLFAVGYSLGGSCLLNTLASTEQAKHVQAACGVSVPYQLGLACERMNQGVSRIYRENFLKTLKAKIHAMRPLLKKHGVELDWARMDASHDFWVYDDCVTAVLNGFDSAEDYYTRCSTYHKLDQIDCPTLLVHAHDDPFMTPQCIPKQVPHHFTLIVCEHGGHVGFIAKKSQKNQSIKNKLNPLKQLDFNWLDQQILTFFKEHK